MAEFRCKKCKGIIVQVGGDFFIYDEEEEVHNKFISVECVECGREFDFQVGVILKNGEYVDFFNDTEPVETDEFGESYRFYFEE